MQNFYFGLIIYMKNDSSPSFIYCDDSTYSHLKFCFAFRYIKKTKNLSFSKTLLPPYRNITNKHAFKCSPSLLDTTTSK